MIDGNAIEVHNVTKQFRVYKDKGHSLKEKVLFHERNRYEVRTVLNNISFTIKKGEAVGLIGRNGCGKSTTLKLLTRIIYPDEGSIEVNGRVSSLLELGAGFHPDLSGRDNIYINASIFGLTKKEIDARLQDIIDFSELNEFIDNPVRTYSSGMYMRLAFSVAIHVNADILLIDEILAVGDTNFQTKCFNKLQEIKASGTTIVIVSHSLQQIESICDRSIWINDGTIMGDGYTYSIHIKYLKFMTGFKLIDDDEFDGSKLDKDRFAFKNVVITGETGDVEQHEFEMGDYIRLKINYSVKKKISGDIVVSIIRRDGVRCSIISYSKEKGNNIELDGKGTFSVGFPDIQLIENEYHIEIKIMDKEGFEINRFEGAAFKIVTKTSEHGVSHMEHEWKIN